MVLMPLLSRLLTLLVIISIPLFFFQAEDGIRDRNVTGVQTCALPIFRPARRNHARLRVVCGRCDAPPRRAREPRHRFSAALRARAPRHRPPRVRPLRPARSEERRVGKEGRHGGWPAGERRTEKERNAW